MKFSPSSIGALVFTAIGTTAFVGMAQRPAVDPTAMQFGMINSSAQVTSTEEKEATSPTSIPETKDNTPEEIQTMEKTVGDTPVEEKTAEKEEQPLVSQNEAEKTPAESNETTNVVPQETTEIQTTPSTDTAENNAPASKESIPTQMIAPIIPDIAPTAPSLDTQSQSLPTPIAVMDTSTKSEPVTESITPPASTTEQTEDIQTTVSTENTETVEVATPIPTQSSEPEITSANTAKPIENTENIAAASDTTAAKITEATIAPRTIKVRTDELFGDSLPAGLTNQLPEIIEIPLELLLNRTVPAEATAPK